MTRLFLLLILLSSQALADPSIHVNFSPDGGSTEAVVAVIASAEKSIHLAGYGFTSKPIAEALVAARARGVDVEIVLDKSNAGARYSEAGFVAENGVAVRVDAKHHIMHSKYAIADGAVVEVGSFNYTKAAEVDNAESLVVIHDEAVADQFEANWRILWAESEPFK